MKLLFSLDKHDYDPSGPALLRDSARSIIIKGCRIWMIHSLKYDYYKFPGGGIEQGESMIDALIRETAEEAGLRVKPDSVREYGCVRRVQKSTYDGYDHFIQNNFYFTCDVYDDHVSQKLDGYESAESFTPELVDPLYAIRTNRTKDHGPKDSLMIERESLVLEMLLKDGYFK